MLAGSTVMLTLPGNLRANHNLHSITPLGQEFGEDSDLRPSRQSES